MKLRVTSRPAVFVALVLISVIGVLLVLQATPEGAGLSDDSIAYIAGARIIVAGSGYRGAWLASNQPVTHFPPAFPVLLSFFGYLGIDPLHAARWVNALLFGASAFVLGILGWRMTPSLTAGLVLAGLFVLSGDLLQVYAVAMSEPLFIFLSLLSIWMFDLYFERPRSWWWLVVFWPVPLSITRFTARQSRKINRLNCGLRICVPGLDAIKEEDDVSYGGSVFVRGPVLGCHGHGPGRKWGQGNGPGPECE